MVPTPASAASMAVAHRMVWDSSPVSTEDCLLVLFLFLWLPVPEEPLSPGFTGPCGFGVEEPLSDGFAGVDGFSGLSVPSPGFSGFSVSPPGCYPGAFFSTG